MDVGHENDLARGPESCQFTGGSMWVLAVSPASTWRKHFRGGSLVASLVSRWSLRGLLGGPGISWCSAGGRVHLGRHGCGAL